MNNIKRVSLFFRILFQAAFIILPVLMAIEWINAPQIKLLSGAVMLSPIPAEHAYPILHPLTAMDKTLGFLVSMIPTGIELFILYFLIKLFRLYEKGEIFSTKNVNYIRNIGYTLLLGQLIHPLYEALLSLALTWGNPPHQHLRFITVTFNGTNAGILLIALFVILISWIMAEGCKLREEQQLTI